MKERIPEEGISESRQSHINMASASKSNLQQQPKPTPSSASATSDAQGIPGDLATASTSQDSHCQSSASIGAPEQTQEQSRARLTPLKAAFSYLKEVEHILGSGQILLYNEFLCIIKKFKAKNVDILSMISLVSRLFTHFKDHAQLAVGFNTFLPQDYKIEAESNASIKLHLSVQTAVRFSQSNTSFHMSAPTTPNDQQEFDNLPEDALYYLFQLKEHFGNQSDSYAEFASSLSKYMSQQIDVFDAIIHMSTFFTGHRELIEGLNTFLTSDHEIKVRGNDVFVLQPGQPAQCLCQLS